ncbi:MAG: hypothetical protein K2O85_03595 [Helicobacter sp.]|nr:hypothetical protein [Helicobacter sp.]
MRKKNIAMASWIQDKGFNEKDLNEMDKKDFEKLQNSFIDLKYLSWRIQEREELSKRTNATFDVDEFILEFFADNLINPNLLDVPDLLFEEIEQKRQLEDEQYQPKKKEKESIIQKVNNVNAAIEKVEQFLKT